MITKVLEFPKSKKSPVILDREVNAILSQYSLFYAHQVENQDNGKIVLTLLLKPYDQKSKKIVQAQAFRKTRSKETEAELNKSMANSDRKTKFFTQSLSGNTITSILFFEIDKDKIKIDQDKEESNN